MARFSRIIPLAALLAAGSAAAQAPTKPDGQWRGSVNAGLSLAKGNTDSTDVNASANAVRATQQDKLNFYLTSLYGTKKSNGVRSDSARIFRGGGKYERNLTDRVFGFGSLDLEHDRLQQLDLRGVAAAGAGYHLIKTERTIFDVFAGLTYNHEKFETETRNSAELLIGEESSHKLGDSAAFTQRLAIYPNLSKSGEFRAQFDAGISTSITKKIELKVSLSNRYQSNPLPGIKKTDTLLLTSIGYRFGAD